MMIALICWGICASCVTITLLALWACLILSRERDRAVRERDALNDLLVARHGGAADVTLVTQTRRYFFETPAGDALERREVT